MTTLSDINTNGRPAMRALRIFVIIVALFLLYAFITQTIEISLEKPLNPERQEAFLRVLRLLADPDIFEVNEETGRLVFSETTRITVERIIETIFMALMATTIGTVLAVPVSFLAARNLMAPVTAPLAAIMAALAVLPLGGWLAFQATAVLIALAEATSGSLIVALGVVVAAAVAIFLLLRLGNNALEQRQPTGREAALLLLRLLAILALILLALGVLA